MFFGCFKNYFIIFNKNRNKFIDILHEFDEFYKILRVRLSYREHYRYNFNFIIIMLDFSENNQKSKNIYDYYLGEKDYKGIKLKKYYTDSFDFKLYTFEFVP